MYLFVGNPHVIKLYVSNNLFIDIGQFSLGLKLNLPKKVEAD